VIASVVIQNLAYLVGALVVAAVLGLAVTMRHRRPRSVEANVESFNRGLRALSPDAEPARRRRGGPADSPARAARRATVTPAPPTRPVRPADAGSEPHPTTEAETG
jgi:hypothetical protein